MTSPEVDIQSRFIHALRTQASHKSESYMLCPLPCPDGHAGSMFKNIDQFPSDSPALPQFPATTLSKRARCPTPDNAGLFLQPYIECKTSPSVRTKRRAESEFRAGRTPKHVQPADTKYSSSDLSIDEPSQAQTKHHDVRLCRLKEARKGVVSPRRSTVETTHDRSHTPDRRSSCQPGLIELQKYDSRYPGLLLQPNPRPISQEKLASEVKSIYAGLTMVETKCIHVDRTHSAAPQDSTQRLAPDHWKAIITLHRTLLHEHHAFSSASQHPSASNALRRLAAKYILPARMWKHGIHAYLELLQRKNSEASLDYMLAFFSLFYQMSALLYETVSAFENTSTACFATPGRHNVAIMMLSKPPGEDYTLSHDTCSNKQTLSDRLLSVLSRLRNSFEGGLARLHPASRLYGALAFVLLVQKTTAASNTQPPSAVTSTGSPPPSLGPLIVDKTPFDYAMYGIVATYLACAWLLEPLTWRFFGHVDARRVRDAAKYCSLTLMVAMAFVWAALMGDRLAAGIYISVVKIWAAATLHFVVVDCSDAIDRNFHIAKFFGLAIVFEFTGMAMQQFAAPSALKALPPSLTVAAVVNWALYILTNHVPLTDVERSVEPRLTINDDVPGDDPAAIRLHQRSGHQQTGFVDNSIQARRRNSVHMGEGSATANDVSSGNNPVASRAEAASYDQESGTVHSAYQLGHSTRYQQVRHEDPRFVIGDSFDDISLHHE